MLNVFGRSWGEKLDRLLGIYGGMKQKSFRERVRLYRAKGSPRDYLFDLIKRCSEDQIKTALPIVTATFKSTLH